MTDRTSTKCGFMFVFGMFLGTLFAGLSADTQERRHQQEMELAQVIATAIIAERFSYDCP